MLKDRIAAGETLLGTFLKTPSPILVEVLGGCGVDLVCLDAEHAPFDRGDLDRCIMAARAVGLPVLVRTATVSPEHILNALDCGADGVLLPHIRNAREAAATALAASYGPAGAAMRARPAQLATAWPRWVSIVRLRRPGRW